MFYILKFDPAINSHYWIFFRHYIYARNFKKEKS